MQDLIILKDTTAIVQSNGKIYTDTFDNFLQDYGALPKTNVTRPLTVEAVLEKYRFRHSTPEDDNTVTENVNITAIDYNRETKSCWLNGYAFQSFPNELCENILNSIDTILAAKATREHVEPTLEELKADKIAVLKNERDTKEVEPITYNGNNFDYDEKARDRINAAIIALDMAGAEATLQWTTADNTNATVTAQDLRNIIAAVAMRSNTLHEQYRVAKEAVNAAETKEEVEAVTLEGNADV